MKIQINTFNILKVNKYVMKELPRRTNAIAIPRKQNKTKVNFLRENINIFSLI